MLINLNKKIMIYWDLYIDLLSFIKNKETI
jgi:hypothetical protein